MGMLIWNLLLLKGRVGGRARTPGAEEGVERLLAVSVLLGASPCGEHWDRGQEAGERSWGLGRDRALKLTSSPPLNTPQDWWNSTSFSNYYRTWNVVVHDWLYSYVYQDGLWVWALHTPSAPKVNGTSLGYPLLPFRCTIHLFQT